MKKLFVLFISCILVASLCNIQADAISAKAAILINGDTGEIIYEKSANLRLSMASTTKIMTAVLLLENKKLSDTVIVTDEMLRVEGSSMGLKSGDKVSFYDLLYGLMLSSGNDAANVVAISIGGSLEGFAKMMNAKAKEIGLLNTSFVTPSGLDSENHYTTAYDLSMLTRYALENDEFARAVSTKSVTLYFGNPPYRRTLTNHNRLLNMVDGVIGVKTGFTKKSGRCLVSAYKKDGKYLIAVTLNAPNDWADHKSLIDYGISKTRVKCFNFDNEYLLEIENADSLTVTIPSVEFSYMDDGFITAEPIFLEGLTAPIKKGQLLGYAVYKYKDKVIRKTEILALYDIKEIESKPQNKGFFSYVKDVFLGIWEN